MKKILVLEDNVDLLRLYGKVLVKAGYQVDLVNTLGDVERHLTGCQYDLFICDMQVGESTSLSMLDAWIERLRAIGTRVVAISGRMKYAESCAALGVDRFIIKPVMSDVMRMMVQELLAPPVSATPVPLYDTEWGHM
jgi:DNA-binding NtrC family response regulator